MSERISVEAVRSWVLEPGDDGLALCAVFNTGEVWVYPQTMSLTRASDLLGKIARYGSLNPEKWVEEAAWQEMHQTELAAG